MGTTFGRFWSGCLAMLLLVVQALAGEIPIVIDRVLPDGRDPAPVRFGVPFPIDTLKVGEVDSVRVVDDLGAVVPHQALVTATWSPQGDRGVRWLLVDLQVRRQRQYKLLFNEATAPAAAAVTPIATLQGDRIVIDAGAIKGELTTRGFDPFHQLQSMGAPIAVGPGEGQQGLGPREFSAFYVEHETKGIFRSDLDPEATVTLEESGPMRAIVKADGWYANAAGEKFCRYSIRLHIMRGQPDLRVDHTWIYTGLSKEDRVRSVSMQIRRVEAKLGDRVRGFTGSDDLAWGNAAADFGGNIRLVQDTSAWGRYDFVGINPDGTRNRLAERGGGWLTTIGSAHTWVALRDAWQQFPWGMDLEGGIIRVHFWPPGQYLLDTTWDGYWQRLTEDQKKRFTATKPRPGNVDVEGYMAVLRQKTNGTGAAKTHELHMSFLGPGYGGFRDATPGGYSSLAREVAYPVLAAADPQWMAQTRALDWMPQAPRDRELFRDEENFFDAMLQMVQEATEKNQWYGFWEWGGYHQHLYPGPQLPRPAIFTEDYGQNSWHRARPKSHYLWGGFPWLQYFRSADRKWLRYAQTYTLYSADRAHAHHDGHGRKAGAEYHYDNSEVPWLGGYQKGPGGDQVASNLQAKDDYVYMYWLTGDRRALDVLKSSADLICNSGTYGEFKPGFSVGNEIRNAGMLLHRMTMAYQATWDPRYLDKARRIAAAFFPLTDPAKVAVAEKNPEVYFHSALGWAYEGMWFYWNVTQDEQMRPALMAFIDRGRDYGGGVVGCYSTSKALVYGYMLTQDMRYLDLARAILDDHVSVGVETYQFLPNGKMNLSGLSRVMGAMMVAPSAWQRANLPTHVRGRTINFRSSSFAGADAMAPHRAFIREGSDGAWSFSLVSVFGGRFVLYKPDGGVAVEVEVKDRCALFNVPADGQSGDYMLVCAEPNEESKANRNHEYKPMSRIVGCRWPVTVEGGRSGQVNAVHGRAFYFASGDAEQPTSVFVGEVDHRRPMVLRAVEGTWQVSNQDSYPGMGGGWGVTLPKSPAGTIYGLELLVPPYWLRPNTGRPRTIVLNRAPTYVAANPEDLFIPVVPKGH